MCLNILHLKLNDFMWVKHRKENIIVLAIIIIRMTQKIVGFGIIGCIKKLISS